MLFDKPISIIHLLSRQNTVRSFRFFSLSLNKGQILRRFISFDKIHFKDHDDIYENKRFLLVIIFLQRLTIMIGHKELMRQRMNGMTIPKNKTNF